MTTTNNQPNTTPPICGACGEVRTTFVAPITLYVKDGTVEDSVWECPACGTWVRAVDFDDQKISSHFDVASFTQPANEARFRRMRAEFFRRLVLLGAKHANRPLAQLRLLDIGPSYGHLIEDARRDGVPITDGLERVDRLRERLQDNGFTIYETVDAIPPEQCYDLITLIDCLYCFQDPAALLEGLRPHLTDNGVLLIRVTNKTHLLRFVRRIGRTITSDLVSGDGKQNFSPRGIRALLNRTGFRVDLYTGREAGKRLPTFFSRVLHHSLYWLSAVTRRPVSLGMVIVASPNRATDARTGKQKKDA